MQLDRAFLERHSSFVADDIEERAFHFDVESDRCFGLLYMPPVPASTGFVVCHSYALEFLTLRRIERAVARALASAGYPVMSFHSRGYGDSTGSVADATLESHLVDVRAAAKVLAAETGATQIGLIGAQFGALTAGAVARAGDINSLILISPAFSGARYFRGLIRNKHMVELANAEGGHRRSMGELVGVLDGGGMIDLLGFALHGHLYKALSEIDLTTDLGRFSGDALSVQITKRSSPSRDAEAFSKRVSDGGGSCRLAIVQEPPGVNIGGPAFVSTSDPMIREDLQEPVVAEIAGLVKEWMTR
jgi:pimeloyl-ACP methyl ester carboxylesterase